MPGSSIHMLLAKFTVMPKILDKSQRISTFVPRPLKSRFRAMEEITFDLRHSDNNKTMIKYSTNDLVLYSRDNSSQRWTAYLTSNLPPIETEKLSNIEPSVFIDVSNIGNSAKNYSSFPCSQQPTTTQETDDTDVRNVDMLLVEDDSSSNQQHQNKQRHCDVSI